MVSAVSVKAAQTPRVVEDVLLMLMSEIGVEARSARRYVMLHPTCNHSPNKACAEKQALLD